MEHRSIPEQMAGMAVFAKVVELQGFSAAARSLGITKSAVSKQLARLEQLLGSRLLHRSTRSLSMTEAGEALYARAVQAVALCTDAGDALALLGEQAGGAVRGTLRLTAPLSYGKQCIAPLLPALLARHPELKLRLLLLDREVDLAEEGLDLAIRVTRRLPPGLVARRLGGFDYVLCAAPGLLKRGRRPARPAELAALSCLGYDEHAGGAHWVFDAADGSGSERVKGSGPLQVNNSEALRDAVLQGLGAALLPDYLVRDDLAAGRLKRLLPGWTPRPPFGNQAYAVWLPERRLTPKVRACVDFLLERLAPPT
jgi:DNA-binding transcriptional LysR family regulator